MNTGSDGYKSLTSWLYSLHAEGIKFGLENTRELLHRVGDPHLSFRSIHVAGTNGKGSTCAFLDSVLRTAGLHIGLYTSPHLVDFTERIKVDGSDITRERVEELAYELRPIVEDIAAEGIRLTFFEVTTVMAFMEFRDKGVGIAVVETGMGGRLDATNLLLPDVSVITPIGLEHSYYLGDTLESISSEKAGIIKPGVPVFTNNTGVALDVIRSRCDELGSQLSIVDPQSIVVAQEMGPTMLERNAVSYELGIPGRIQTENAMLALEVLERMFSDLVSIDDMRKGIADARWPARLETINVEPRTILDSTHNPPGAIALSREMPSLGTDLVLVLGVLQDKDADGICRVLGPLARSVVVTEADTDRAMAADRLAKVMAVYNDDVTVVECPGEAILKAWSMVTDGGVVLVTGSIYLAGDVKRWMMTRR